MYDVCTFWSVKGVLMLNLREACVLTFNFPIVNIIYWLVLMTSVV